MWTVTLSQYHSILEIKASFSLREKVEKKLQELQQMDIIEKVQGPTP